MATAVLIALALAAPPNNEPSASGARDAHPVKNLPVLAQRLDLAGGNAARPVQRGNLGRIVPRVIQPDRWQGKGGAGKIALFQRGGGGPAGGRRNNSKGLAGLIQQVVEPDSWEVNGGRGTIAVFGR